MGLLVAERICQAVLIMGRAPSLRFNFGALKGGCWVGEKHGGGLALPRHSSSTNSGLISSEHEGSITALQTRERKMPPR